ncbi:MAG: hypothetical protein NZ874_08810 [Fimbriimonadales bacterium]|nr:hypothetical protein [Fimbriimonadales bacterium]
MQPADCRASTHALLRAVLRLLRLTALWLAVDATTLRQHYTGLGISIVCHQTAIPVTWRVLPATQRGAGRPEWEALLAVVRRGMPRGLPVYGLANRGLWAAWLFTLIRWYGWHPLLRVNPRGQFRACWQRQAQPLTGFCAAQGTQRAVEGRAFRYGVRWTVVVFWGACAQEPWHLLTDLPASAVWGAWYGLRGWMEQGFGRFKRGGWGWHRARGVARGWVFGSGLVCVGAVGGGVRVWGGGVGCGVVGWGALACGVYWLVLWDVVVGGDFGVGRRR